MVAKTEAIHFIIPCYRAAKTLGPCLNSIFNLDYPWEQIRVSVVENGSREDGVKEVLEKYPKVSYYFLQQKSRSLARNHLVPETMEELIAYVDADVTLDRDWATHCLKAINCKSVGAVGGSVYRVGDSFIDDVRRKISHISCYNSNTLETIQGGVTLNTASMLIKRDCLKKVGLFDVGLKRYEDSDLTVRLFFCGYHIASAPLAKSYVMRSDSIFSYLFLRPLSVGYFESKSLAGHPFPRGTFWSRFKRIVDCLFPTGHKSSDHIRGYRFFVNAMVAMVKFFISLGFAIGQIRFPKHKNTEQKEVLHLTKILSWDGDVYLLNPLLAVCFRANDMLLIERESGRIFSYRERLGESLRRIISSNLAREEDSEEIKYFKESNIFINPLDVSATQTKDHFV